MVRLCRTRKILTKMNTSCASTVKTPPSLTERMAGPGSDADRASAWTIRAGGNQALCSGDRRVARAWARACYEAFPGLDRLTWTSSVVGHGRRVALTERAADSIPERPDLLCPLSDPGPATAIPRAAHLIGYLVT